MDHAIAAGDGVAANAAHAHRPERVRHVDLTLDGMTCAACAARIETTLNRVPGVAAAVNLATE